MEELHPGSQAAQTGSAELLYFWALGDLHYSAQLAWREHHTPRMSQMFRDLRQLWAREGQPVFCVSPGDIVEMAMLEYYQLASQHLSQNLGSVPFYPGVGNHELFTEGEESEADLLDDFTTFWSKQAHYYWEQGEVLCVMLDVVGYPTPMLTDESLAFLKTALAKHPRHIAIVFAHCPLYNTVLARDPACSRDYDSREPFFFVENSAQVREILARHGNTCLYISGHTHTGWQSPSLVTMENLDKHLLAHVNLSSPWYTGRDKGARWLGDQECYRYCTDEPDYIVSLAVHVSREQIRLRLRDHKSQSWLAEWCVPVSR